MSSGDDFTVIKLDKTTSSIKKEAIYTFYVSPPDTSTTVTMSKVDVDQGSPIQGITLNPEDFILTPDLKDGMILTLKLSLSDTGIQKFKDAKEATEIRYRAELDFKTSGQTKKMTISISVIPVHITTKQEVENMIKALGTIEVSPDGAPGIKSSFDFSGFQLSETEFEIEESDITPDASLKDTLGLDSLDLVDVVVLVEQNFGITLTGPDFIGIATFKDFYELLHRKING